MDERGYWGLIAGAWQEVDGGATFAALSQNEPLIEIEDRFRKLLAGMIARLAALPLDDARSAIDHHHACIRALARGQIMNAAGWWKYDRDGDAIALVPLLGETFYRRVVASPDAVATLARASGLAALGGWQALAEPVLALDQRRILGDFLRLHYEHWHYGPLAEPNSDLGLALAQLDASKPSPRRPHKRR